MPTSERHEPPRYELRIDAIPDELRQTAQWLPWRWGTRAETGRLKKPPVHAATGMPVDGTQPANWTSFEQAYLVQQAKGYAGVGFALGQGGSYTVIDPDDCRNAQTGDLTTWAQELVERFTTYTEVSPSGTGLRIILKGRLPGNRRGWTRGEVFDANHFFTITGNHLDGTPKTIEDRQDVLEAWYGETFRADGPEPASQQTATTSDDRDDDTVLRLARACEYGALFERLMAGEWEGLYPSASEAMMRLMGLLTFFTQDTEQLGRLFLQSAFSTHPKAERPDYLQRTIDRALRGAKMMYSGTPKRQDRRVIHRYEWQSRKETAAEREAYLLDVSRAVKGRVRRHVEVKDGRLHVEAVFPGAGKSFGTAELGLDYDIAWIVERHSMRGSVPALQRFRHIQPCTEKNCPYWKLHQYYAPLGYALHPFHQSHGCAYDKQHRGSGSAMYQLDHVPTAYPKKHEAIVVDELNLTSWLKERAITYTDIQQNLAADRLAFGTLDTYARYLLRAVRATITEAEESGTILWGKSLFDVLNKYCHARLIEYVETLSKDGYLMQPRPDVWLDPDNAKVMEAMMQKPMVVLPHLVKALQGELLAWHRGGQWNSRLRIACKKEWALRIIEPRRFSVTEGDVLPPLALLDATADREILERLFGLPVDIERIEPTPPPNLRHIAVRTGKRYAKRNLTTGKTKAREQRVAINEVLYLLRELDSDGQLRRNEKVGIISYQDCVDALGEALGIPESRRAHFYGVRGSNELEACEVLIIVGTPTPPIDELEWWARALYSDDPIPIDERSERVDGVWRYRDPRMQRLIDYLIAAELTQCAHRNRPLRYGNRVVITMCQGDVDYLPATETIIAFPQLAQDGERHDEAQRRKNDEKLQAAWAAIMARNEYPSIAKLKKESGLGTTAVSQWHQHNEARQAEKTS